MKMTFTCVLMKQGVSELLGPRGNERLVQDPTDLSEIHMSSN